jgi:hypothetical protein
VADAVAVVAKAVPVKRSVKAIANNSPWFLVIATYLPKFNRKMFHVKK